MARINKLKLVSDIELELVQSSPSQDLQIEHRQIAFVATNVRNALVAQEILQLLKQGKQIPPIYLTRETCKQLTEESTSCVSDGDDGMLQRYNFVLTGQVVDVDDDKGIVLVETDEREEIYKASIASLPMLKGMRFTKPTSQLLVWSRQGDDIYVDGFLESDLDFNKIIVTYAAKQDLLELDDDDTVNITDKLVVPLIERVVEILKLELYGTQQDVTNDGNQDQKPVYARTVQNVQPQPQQE